MSPYCCGTDDTQRGTSSAADARVASDGSDVNFGQSFGSVHWWVIPGGKDSLTAVL